MSTIEVTSFVSIVYIEEGIQPSMPNNSHFVQFIPFHKSKKP